ncbi:MAG: fimbria/pilus outer membrane usher protein [Pseudomonadota bacterium]
MSTIRTLTVLALLAASTPLLAIQTPARPAVRVVALEPDPCDSAPLQELLLDTVINASATGREIIYLQRPCGGILAKVEDLAALRILTNGRPTVQVNGEDYLLLNAFPGLIFGVDEEKARMVIEGEPFIFVPTIVNIDARPTTPALPAAAGALFNYGLFAFGDIDGARQQTLQNYQLTLFGKPGVLDSQVLLLGGSNRLQPFRVFTTYTRDDEENLRSLRVGDVFSRGGVWGAVRPLGGVQLARNYSLRPNLVTTPVTTLDVAVRRRSALSLNGSSLFEDPAELGALYFGNLGAVPYGPVQVINLPAGYSNRRLRLRAQQVAGTPQVDLQSDFYSLGLLRGGFRDYSYEVGVNRRDFLGDQYRNLVSSGTERLGLTQWLTLETHAEASSRQQAAGLALTSALPYFGVLETSLAGSGGADASGISRQYSAALVNVYEYFGYRLSYRHFTRGFVLPTFEDGARTRDQLQASVSTRAPAGTVFVGYSQTRTYAGADSLRNPANSFLFAGYSASLLRRISVSVFVGRSLSAPRDTSVSAALSIPFTLFDSLGEGGEYATQAQLAINQDSDRNTRADLQLGRAFVDGDSIYNVEAAQSIAGSDFTSLYGSWLHPRLTASAQVSRSEGGNAYSLGAAGALAYIGGRVLASRPIGSSFALVRLGEDYAGTHVNSLPTDAKGDVLIPDLAAYVDTPLQLDPRELPLSFQPESLSFTARAPFRSGVILSPKLALRRDALVKMVLREGGSDKPAPIGSYATIEGRDDEFPVGDGGLLYFYGIGEVTEFRFYSRDTGCLIKLVLPPLARANAEALAAIPELGPFVCEGAAP